MNRTEILRYIEKKKYFIDNDYKIYFIFELLYLPQNEELYKRKLCNLDRKLEEPLLLVTPYKMKNFLAKSYRNNFKDTHVEGVKLIHSASIISGFSSADIGLVKQVYSNEESKENKCDDFVDAFEKLISDPEAISTNSVIILSQDVHHMEKLLKRKAETCFIANEKKRKLAAESKGQRTITDYFKSTKSTGADDIEKKTINGPVYKLEDIILTKRGSDCNIKILWIPKSHEELNPVSYMSVFFCNEVVSHISEDQITPIEACKLVLDRMPNDLWSKLVEYIEKLEKIYMRDFGVIMEKSNNESEHVET